MKDLNDDEVTEFLISCAEKYKLKGSITKINFINCIDLILNLQDKGLNKKEIWAILKEKEMIFCEYAQFTKLYRKFVTKERIYERFVKIKQNEMLNTELSNSKQTNTSVDSNTIAKNVRNLNSSDLFSFSATADKQALI